MFTYIEKLIIEGLYQNIKDNPLPFDKQEAQKDDEGFWCFDWWSSEVCRCLFREEKYLSDSFPIEAKNNTLWKVNDILTAVDYKLNMIKILKEYSNFSDELFVCEVGRGIDILLASFIKKWKKIICYDINPFILEKVNSYFKELSIESFRVNSGDFDFSKIDERVILLANQCRLGKKCTEDIKNNPNILAIIDGILEN